MITDRYPQTQIADTCDGPRYYKNNLSRNEKILNKLLVKIEEKSFKVADEVKPDLVVVLKVSSDVANTRKPDEVDINSHTNLMRSILELDFGENTDRTIIDANQELNIVINETLSAIWKCL